MVERENTSNTKDETRKYAKHKNGEEPENLSEAVHGKIKSFLPSFSFAIAECSLDLPPSIQNQKYAKIITESVQVSAIHYSTPNMYLGLAWSHCWKMKLKLYQLHLIMSSLYRDEKILMIWKLEVEHGEVLLAEVKGPTFQEQMK